MKHAILIMAHKNYSFLHHLIEYFERDCYVFVHIDKKSEITKDEIACLRQMPQVAGVYQKYSVHWGGFSILKCELFMLKDALKKCDADYFHVISGQDYPIKPIDVFLEYFRVNYGFSFAQYVHLPHPRWQQNTYERFVYYYPYDVIDRRTSKNPSWIRKTVDYQKKWGIKRHIPQHFDHLYGGSQWFSLHKNALEKLLDYSRNHKSFYRRLKWTFAPEETFFTSVLVNVMPVGMVINNNHRYIRWKLENGNIPANLGPEHFYYLSTSQDFFARKMEEPYCADLLKLIDRYLLHDAELRIMPHGGWDYNGFKQYHYSEELTRLLTDYVKRVDIHDVLDCGCGAGFYVAALCRRGIMASGIDANPNTASLSSLLFEDGKTTCIQGDLTDRIRLDKTFGLVLCLNVLPDIPRERLDFVLTNLLKLTGSSLVLGWNDGFQYEQYVLCYVLQNGFKKNYYVGKLFEEQSSACSHFFIMERE